VNGCRFRSTWLTASSCRIKLQGQVDSFDQYVVLLKNSVTQMVYKHAISTVVPSRPVTIHQDIDNEA